MTADTRTLADLAREADLVQGACNLSGVVLSWGRAIQRLRRIAEEQNWPDQGTTAINTHPINQAFASKVMSLACYGSEPNWFELSNALAAMQGAQ